MDAVAESLARIEQRLISLEQKVEQIIAPPAAYRVEDAAKMLGYEMTAFREFIRRGKIRTIKVDEGGHPRIPKSELVRITAVSPDAARRPPMPRGTRKIVEADEVAAIRALSKRR